jgi:hypothetical protein
MTTKWMIAAVALTAGTGIAMAQNASAPIGQKQPDATTGEAAPATTKTQDGVRNGTNKEERDQHGRVDKNPSRGELTTLPAPAIDK